MTQYRKVYDEGRTDGEEDVKKNFTVYEHIETVTQLEKLVKKRQQYGMTYPDPDLNYHYIIGFMAGVVYGLAARMTR